MRIPLPLILALTALASCTTTTTVASTAGGSPPALGPRPAPPAVTHKPSPVSPAQGYWEPDSEKQATGSLRQGAVLLQGYIGVMELTSVNVSGGSAGTVTSSSVTMPLIGGGAQWKLAGKGVDLGLEGQFDFAFQSGGGAFATGGSGAVVAVDIDSLLIGLYGGPFIGTFLGKNMRIYGAAGPMLQFANYDQTYQTGGSGSGSGSGGGWYARTGLEFIVSPDMLVGLGLRWVDSSVNLSGGLGDLDTEGYQAVFTVTTGLSRGRAR